MLAQKPETKPCQQRRRLLQAAVGLPMAVLAAPVLALTPARELRFSHTHTGERLTVTYFEGGRYLPDALAEVDVLLRDFRTEAVHRIEPALLDYLHAAQTTVGSNGVCEIISAYRSPATNEMLRNRSTGVAKKSYHMRGKALDIRLTDADTAELRRAAAALQVGGVGYYPKSDFLHIDTGPVRQW